MEREMNVDGDRSKEEEMVVNSNCSVEKVMVGGASTADLKSGDNVPDVYVGKEVVDQGAPVDGSCLPLDGQHGSSSSTLAEGGPPSSGSDRGEIAGDTATSTSGGEDYPHMSGTKASSLKKSLFFEGSVVEAIALSKRLNKMFVVYIALSEDGINAQRGKNGNGDSSLPLDSPRATAVLSRSCCVLQLLQNSADAKQFSSIYPVRIFPTVAVIGLQGTLLAWIEGDNVAGDELAAKLEEAEATFSSQVKSLAASAAAMTAALLAASGGVGGVPPPPPPQAGARLPGQDEQHASPPPLSNSDLPSPPSPTTDVASSVREATTITLTSTLSELPGLQPLESSDGSASQSLAIGHPDNPSPADTPVSASTAEAIHTKSSETEAAVVLKTTNAAGRPERAGGEWQSPAVGEGRGEMGEEGIVRTSLPRPPSGLPLMEVDKLTPSCSQGADSDQHPSGDSLPSSSVKSVNDEEDVTPSVVHRTFGGQETSASKSAEEEPCITMSAAAENQNNQNNETSGSSGPSGLPYVHESPMAPSRVHLDTQGASNGGRSKSSLAASASSILIDTWKKAQIQFRLTDGSSLKGEFGADDKLVKAWDFIAEEGGEKRQSFAMMIPFPRRVLGQDDMEKTFREMELVPRATIILMPIAGEMPSRQQAVPSMVGGVARGVGERDGSGDAGPSGGGHIDGGTASSGLLGTVFWGVGRGVGRLLSYFNPFSYLWGGEHNSGGQRVGAEGGRQQEGWEYQPNPTLERVIRNAGRQGGAGGGEARIGRAGAGFLPAAAVAGGQHGDLVSRRPSDGVRNDGIQRDMPDARTDPSTGAAAGSAGTTQRRGGAGWGANVHVLRQSEDDFHGGNAFWNGNSTQFGADGDGRGGGM